MSSSIANDVTKWSDEQLRENEVDNDELFEKKSVEPEQQAAEEVVRQKAEEKAKRKAEAEAKVHAEEVAWVQSSVTGPSKGKQPRAVASKVAEVVEQAGGLAPCFGCSDVGAACEMKAAGSSKARSCDRCRQLKHKCERLGDAQPTRQRKWEEAMSPQAGKKKARTKILVADNEEDDEDEGEEEEDRDALGALTEVLLAVVAEMRNMAADRRRTAVESRVQVERVLGTLEDIRGCLDPEFVLEEPEGGLEEEFEEEEVVEAAEEREALKGRNEEEAEVDESL
ncbi:hypothetical protein PAXRUDRAFT_15106 [Paxillus rubicundulus Ve08.2h10]|uniref:Zn(2)-C6 fungal-type domain-containing protein n=1 Tax=Paxillus rubicundulus Ve08.2h10 TaxID=930991 RepID=A0A0D0DC24_9AGAM|nr:hypothetical protein PAXRUDRAFT_15106 [Paxillus rubicundulus Ve08.2h10]